MHDWKAHYCAPHKRPVRLWPAFVAVLLYGLALALSNMDAPSGAVCQTDVECAEYDRLHGYDQDCAGPEPECRFDADSIKENP